MFTIFGLVLLYVINVITVFKARLLAVNHQVTTARKMHMLKSGLQLKRLETKILMLYGMT